MNFPDRLLDSRRRFRNLTLLEATLVSGIWRRCEKIARALGRLYSEAWRKQNALPGYSAERSLYQSRLHYSGAFNATTRPGVSLAVYRRPGYSSAREQCDLNCSKEYSRR